MTPIPAAKSSGHSGMPRPILLGRILCLLLTVGSLAWAADLYRSLGLGIMNEQFYAGMLVIIMPAVFICLPRKGQSDQSIMPWYDVIAAAICCLSAVYVAVEYPTILDNFAENPPEAVVAGAILLVGVAEGLRRSAGNILFAFLLFFILFALFGQFIPGRLQGEEVSLERLAIYLSLDSNGMFGFALKVTLTVVVVFVFFGLLLEPAGGAGFFTDISSALMGRYRGGSSKIAIVASSLFGSISGSAVSNVMSTGVITIPLMRKGGYPAHSAAAIEAVASTGGQLMPPMMGVAAFVMADMLQVEYIEIVLAALIPAILYYATLFIQVDLLAARDGIKSLPASMIGAVWPILRAGGLFVIPFVVVVVCLFVFSLQAETSALFAAISILPIGILVGYKDEKLTSRKIVDVFIRTGRAGIEIIMIGGAAGIIIGVLNLSGLGFALTLELVNIGDGNLAVLLLLAAVICIILGMGMPTIAVYILLATLVAPAIIELGVPAMAAHLFVFYYGLMSMITPPVAIAAFSAASLAGAPMMKTGWSSVKFGWSAYLVPFLFVMSPNLIMQGEPLAIIISFVTALLGVWSISVGIMGYFMKPVGKIWRTVCGVIGLALLLPTGTIPQILWINLAGFVVLLVFIFTEVSARRQTLRVE